jgi:hypothetical protein
LDSSANLEQSIHAVRAAVQGVPLALKEMERGLSESAVLIRNSVSLTAKTLSDDVQRSSNAATLLTTKLVEVAQVVIDKTADHQQRRPGVSS